MSREIEAILVELRESILERYGREAVTVCVNLRDATQISLPFPLAAGGAAPGGPKLPGVRRWGDDCTLDILHVLEDAGHRLTTTRILSQLARAGAQWSERSVSGTLARMVEDGTLTNDQHAKPRGYGLAEWSSE